MSCHSVFTVNCITGITVFYDWRLRITCNKQYNFFKTCFVPNTKIEAKIQPLFRNGITYNKHMLIYGVTNITSKIHLLT